MTRIAFVVARKEFNAIRKGSQTSIFRGKSKTLTKRLEKKYDFLEIRNGVMANRPKIFFEFAQVEELEDGYHIYFGKKDREENMKDEFRLIGEKLCK